jgi:FkbM family methyltransferase
MNILQKILQSKALERSKRWVGIKTGFYLKFKRFTASSSEEMRTAMLCKHMQVDLVIDVGANTGQFAESLYDFGYIGKVVSFEPVSHVWKQLKDRAAQNPHWTVAERCAIGDTDGEIFINISDDTVFSSVLPIKDDYVEHNKKSKIVHQEATPIYRLDTIIGQYVNLSEYKSILLKIDTQGYEKEALAGSQDVFNTCIGLKIEIPLYAMYNDTGYQFYDILQITKENGFLPYSFNIEGVDLHTGRVNTIDGLFFRAK